MISLQHLVAMRRKVAAAPAGQFETMDLAKWKQTAIDVPLVALAAGAGYGISKTVADRIASKRLAQGQAFSPATKKYLPIGLAIGNALMGYGVARLREEAKARRGVRSELQRMAEKRSSSWLDEPVSGRFPGSIKDPPEKVKIRGMTFTRSKGAPRHGSVAQYRENKTHDSAHMYVRPDRTYIIDHRDKVSPRHSLVQHFIKDVVPSTPRLVREWVKSSGVEPAPQSRGIPKKKPSDPWAYDPRPTFEL